MRCPKQTNTAASEDLPDPSAANAGFGSVVAVLGEIAGQSLIKLAFTAEDPPRWNIARRGAVRGFPPLEQLVSSHNFEAISAVIEEPFLFKLVDKPRGAHYGDVCSLSKLRRIPNRLSWYGDELLRETLPQENLQHPLV